MGSLPNSPPIQLPSTLTPSEKKDELPHPCKTIYKYDYNYEQEYGLASAKPIRIVMSPHAVRQSQENYGRVQSHLRSNHDGTNSS